MRPGDTHAKMSKHAAHVKKVLEEIEAGLNGHPFAWGATEADSKQATALHLGYTLVTKSYMEKHGHELKLLQEPVGSRYYKSPLNKSAKLYVLEIQARRSMKWSDLWKKGKALIEADHRVKLGPALDDYWVKAIAEKQKRNAEIALDEIARLVPDGYDTAEKETEGPHADE